MPSLERIRRQRPGDPEALDGVAALGPEEGELTLVLHALRHHPQIEDAGQADDRSHDRPALGLVELDERVLAAYLFGSWVRGSATETSDVDVAVLIEANEPRTLSGPLDDIARAVEHATGRTADIVDLARAPADLVHRVLRDGDLIVERDRSARVRFEVRRRAEYLDLRPYLEAYRAAALT